MGNPPSRLEIWFQTIQSCPYHASLAVPLHTRFPQPTAFSAGCCPLGLSAPGKPVTQEPPSLFFLIASGISQCATRRTLSTGRRSRVCTYETMSACRSPSVPSQAHCLPPAEESVPPSAITLVYSSVVTSDMVW